MSDRHEINELLATNDRLYVALKDARKERDDARAVVKVLGETLADYHCRGCDGHDTDNATCRE